jgi:hypothetical protein
MAHMSPPAEPTGGQKAWAWLLSCLFVALGVLAAVGWSYYYLFGAVPLGIGFLAGIFSPQSPAKTTLSAFVVTMALPSLLRSEAPVCAVFLLPLLWLSRFIGSVLRRYVHARRHDHALREDDSEQVRRLRHG